MKFTLIFVALAAAKTVDPIDGYTHHFDAYNAGTTTTHTNAEAKRQSEVAAQAASDAWRDGRTPNAGAVLP